MQSAAEKGVIDQQEKEEEEPHQEEEEQQQHPHKEEGQEQPPYMNECCTLCILDFSVVSTLGTNVHEIRIRAIQ